MWDLLTNGDIPSREPNDPKWAIVRSALIVHGRELLNQAVGCDEIWEAPLSKAKLFKKGVWYLERASEGPLEMINGDNWALLRDENIILPMFGRRL